MPTTTLCMSLGGAQHAPLFECCEFMCLFGTVCVYKTGGFVSIARKIIRALLLPVVLQSHSPRVSNTDTILLLFLTRDRVALDSMHNSSCNVFSHRSHDARESIHRKVYVLQCRCIPPSYTITSGKKARIVLSHNIVPHSLSL